MSDTRIKVCATCRSEKPLSEFGPSRRCLFGRTSSCRVCINERQNKNRKSRATQPPPSPEALAAAQAKREQKLIPTATRLRKERIDLGIAIAHAKLQPGVSRTLNEIASYADCSPQRIRQIEEKALRKLFREIERRGLKPALKDCLRLFGGGREILIKPQLSVDGVRAEK